MDISPYKLDEDAFWADTDPTRDPIPTKLLGKYSGILMDAPRRVNIDVRETFPAALYQLGSFKEMATAPFDRFGVITLMDLEENRLLAVAGASLHEEPDAEPEPPVDPATLAKGNTASADRLELRSLFSLPWRPTRVILTSVLRDTRSNRVEVELGKSPAAFEDPEVVKFQAEQRAKTNVPLLLPPPVEPFVSYACGKDTPPVPAGRDISLAATRVAPLDSDQPSMLHGSYRLPIAKRHIISSTGVVQPGTEEIFAQLAARVKAGESMPTGVVPITLLATGSEDPTPHVWRLVVPTYDKIAQAGEVNDVTGCFSLDLRTLEGFDRRPQTWFIYAFSSEVMVGPVLVALAPNPPAR